MYKEDLALNYLQCLICHKIQPEQIIYLIYLYKENLALNDQTKSYTFNIYVYRGFGIK